LGYNSWFSSYPWNYIYELKNKPMKTQCVISKIEHDGTIKSIHCTNMGYKSYTGDLLQLNFFKEREVDSLISLGDIEEIKPTTKEIRAYHRDMGESLVINQYNNIDHLLDAEGKNPDNEFYYLWDKDKWYFFTKAHIPSIRF